MPRIAVLAAKEAVNRAFEGGLADGVMFERRLFHAMFATADQKEGMDAFVNKRKPAFKNGSARPGPDGPEHPDRQATSSTEAQPNVRQFPAKPSAAKWWCWRRR
jgi:hypothetical protein